MTSMSLPLTQSRSRAETDLEIAAIDSMRRRFSALTVFTIAVSFIHMAASLVLYSSSQWHEIAASLAMTLLVDVVTWLMASLFEYASIRQLQRSGWAKALFGASLLISMLLNFVYLYVHRPADTTVPYFVSLAISIAFAIFVPATIGVSSVVNGELYRDRLEYQRTIAAQQTVSASQSQALPDTASGADNESPTKPAPKSQLVTPVNRTSRPKRRPPVAAFRSASGNGKAAIMTSDVAAILGELRRQDVRFVRSGAELGKILGWRSPSSGPNALKTLVNEGAAVQQEDGSYLIAGDTLQLVNEDRNEAPLFPANGVERALA